MDTVIIQKGTTFQGSSLGHNSIHYPVDLVSTLDQDIEAEPLSWWGLHGLSAYVVTNKIAKHYNLEYPIIWI